MSPRNILVTDPFLVKRPKKSKTKYAGPFSEILDPPLVLVVADGRGAGLSGGSEYLKENRESTKGYSRWKVE